MRRRRAIRYQGRTDVVMMELAPGTTVAGVFTSNKCPGRPGGLVPRGAEGRQGARGGGERRQRQRVHRQGRARRLRRHRRGRRANWSAAPPKQVFVASTGVIGEVLPHQKLVAALPALHGELRDDGWEDAARGIMTTDTFPKAATRTAHIGDGEVRITGIAKGSGMIAPDMATMLCFVVHRREDPRRRTAGAAEEGRRHQLQLHDGGFRYLDLGHRAAVRHRPGEASARAGRGRADARRISRARWTMCCWTSRCRWCATARGRRSWCGSMSPAPTTARSAKRIGLAVANSPLVKTAIAGEDANWGRIVMAVGKAGEPADRDKLSIGVGGVWMARDGGVVPDYDEAPVVQHMKGREVEIAIDIGLGRGKATVWTCDLTHGYIDINGSYRS